MPRVDAVGYRVVHPGAKLDRHVRITDEVMRDLEEAVVFAPLHDPSAIEIIREMMGTAAGGAALCVLRHGVSRDDAGGRDDVCDSGGVSRAGGAAVWISWAELRVDRAAVACEAGIRLPQRMVIAHLGSGCSVTALVDGTLD